MNLRLAVAIALVIPVVGEAAPPEDARQAMFRRVFGEVARLDPARVAEVKGLPAGKRLPVDRDGDGRNDEVWYIDPAARHTMRPLLVRVIDEDGDLDKNLGPDRDSDLYLADWKADGTVDAAVDYQDNDGDGDLDEMGIYYWWPNHRYLKGDALWVWWGRDLGDDNLLWYDVNWTYSQRLCQYRCHFSGDETFVGFGITKDLDRWIGNWENPFAFYDPDGDGCSEVVVRICGVDDEVESLRYSFDADGDARGRQTHDYDFSITAIARGSRWLTDAAPGRSELKIPRRLTHALRLRGIPTGRVIRWDAAEQFAQRSPWARACLTWDEINANTEGNVERDPHERWEGVIAHGSEDFPQIGGPPCSRLNKRVEVSLRPARPLRLYFDPTDHRLHLLGAGEGWLHVDYNLDGKVDARYTYRDDDRDGLFDRRLIDLDADGKIDFEWPMKGKDARRIKLDYESLSAFYRRRLAMLLDHSQRFIDAAKAALGDRPGKPDPVETFFLTGLPSWYPQTRLGQRIRSTPAGARYYVDLLRDRLLGGLKRKFGRHPAWREVEAAYAAGNYAAAAELVLTKLAPDARVGSPARFQGFTHRLPICLDNRHGPRRDNWPVVLGVRAVRAVAEDFNPDNCAVVAPERWIDHLEIPHQVDQLDASAGRELSFLVNLPQDARATYYLYYSPTGRRDKSFARNTAATANRRPTAGWESTFAAYRSDHGQFDFFGRTQFRHSQRVERLIYPLGNVDYHRETGWGMDALQVGQTSGLGGLTLYFGERACLVRNPAGEGSVKFSRRVLSSGPVRAAVEITAENVAPDRPKLALRILCVIYARHQESEIRASVAGAREPVLLAPGLTRLAREETFLDRSLGCLGAWGFQDAAVGEVGLGLIVPADKLKDVLELDGERRLRCDAPGGTLRYWIIGDWRRGRRFPVAPTLSNWRRQLQGLAGPLRRDVRLTIESPQKLP